MKVDVTKQKPRADFERWLVKKKKENAMSPALFHDSMLFHQTFCHSPISLMFEIGF